MGQYQVSLGLFVHAGEEELRQYRCEASSPEEARQRAIDALHKGIAGKIYYVDEIFAQKLEEVPPQGTHFEDVDGIDLNDHPKFCINFIRAI